MRPSTLVAVCFGTAAAVLLGTFMYRTASRSLGLSANFVPEKNVENRVEEFRYPNGVPDPIEWRPFTPDPLLLGIVPKQHLFKLSFRNAGPKDLIIRDVKKACNCLDVRFPASPIQSGTLGEFEVDLELFADDNSRDISNQIRFTVFYQMGDQRLLATTSVSVPIAPRFRSSTTHVQLEFKGKEPPSSNPKDRQEPQGSFQLTQFGIRENDFVDEPKLTSREITVVPASEWTPPSRNGAFWIRTRDYLLTRKPLTSSELTEHFSRMELAYKCADKMETQTISVVSPVQPPTLKPSTTILKVSNSKPQVGFQLTVMRDATIQFVVDSSLVSLSFAKKAKYAAGEKIECTLQSAKPIVKSNICELKFVATKDTVSEELTIPILLIPR